MTSNSCNKLDETVYDRLRSDEFFTSETDVVAAMAPVYSGFRNWLQFQTWWDLEETTDSWVTPTRAGIWFDSGYYQRLHLHTWTAFDAHPLAIWNTMFNNVNNCNRVLFQLENAKFDINGKESYIAEIKTARAFLYYQLCSVFGNVPIVDRYDVPEGYLPETRSRAEVFNFIEKDLQESIPLLNEEAFGSMYGRFNKWAGNAILARLYLNAEAWTGTAKYAEAAQACDQIITANKYNLENQFNANFRLTNDQSREIIFSFPFDEKYTSQVTIYPAFQKTLHIENLTKTYKAKTWGDGGVMAVPSFVNTFDPEDKRLAQSFHSGQQYGIDGEQLFCTGIVAADVGKPLNYTNTLTDLRDAHEWEGYRFGKYEIKIGTLRACDNDWVAIRYAEVLFMKAECLLRTGNAAAAAVIINSVRDRSFDTSKPVTAAELLANSSVNGVSVKFGRMLDEWGWEFTGEGLRREQQIRFGNYSTGSWTEHQPSSNSRNLFPIPQNVLNANRNLVQNPGYN
jgi:hypothetical protein